LVKNFSLGFILHWSSLFSITEKGRVFHFYILIPSRLYYGFGGGENWFGYLGRKEGWGFILFGG